jgi:hypothetical protein
MSERLNIRRMQTPERSEKLPFDPEEDVSAQQWDTVRADIERSYFFGDWESFLAKSAYMKIVSPKEYALAHQMTQGDWSELSGMSARDSMKPWDYEDPERSFESIGRVAHAHILDFDPPVDLALDTDYRDTALNAIENLHDGAPIAVNRAVAISLAYKLPPVQFSAKAIHEIKSDLARIRTLNAFELYTSFAANMRLCGFEVRIQPSDWPKLHETASKIWDECETRQLRYNDYMKMLFNMTVLEAKDARITDKGKLEIVMPKRAEESPAMPTSAEL